MRHVRAKHVGSWLPIAENPQPDSQQKQQQTHGADQFEQSRFPLAKHFNA